MGDESGKDDSTPGPWVDWDSADVWDYEKEAHCLRMRDGTTRWAWPNAGHLTCLQGGGKILPKDVLEYREDTTGAMKLKDSRKYADIGGTRRLFDLKGNPTPWAAQGGGDLTCPVCASKGGRYCKKNGHFKRRR